MIEEKTEAELAAEKEAEDKAKADETAEVEAEAQDAEFEDSLKDLSDEEKEVKREERKKALNSNKEINYKAELEKEKERTKKAEDALAGDRYKASEAKRKAEEAAAAADEVDDEEDKPLTKAEFQAERAKDRQFLQSQMRKNEIEAIVKGLTNDVDEQDYILEIHKNRMFPENLSLQDQLEESFAIANRKKWKGERDEAMRKAKGDEAANNDAAGAYRKPPASKVGEPAMSAEDKKVLISRGWKWNTTAKRYEKTTASGTLLYREKDGSVKTAKK